MFELITFVSLGGKEMHLSLPEGGLIYTGYGQITATTTEGI